MGKKLHKDHIFFGLDLTDEQKEFRDAIYSDDYDIVFSNSKSGTGKSVISIASAKIMVAEGRYDSLVYLFSPVEEDKLGFTPGQVFEKEEKYLCGLYCALETINENPDKCLLSTTDPISLKNGTAWVEAYSHTFLRGVTFSKKIILLDESQNFTIPDLRKVLTRCKDDCKVIVAGHAGQIDLKKKTDSGFEAYIKHFEGQERCKVCNLNFNFRGWLANHADLL
jgi:phosphate starvation-inducible PhoH-like protein